MTIASVARPPSPMPRITVCLPFTHRSNGGAPRPLRSRLLLLLVEELLVEAVRLLLAAVDDLGVALQRAQVGVAEHLLNQAHVSARHLEQRRGGRVARNVG